jgi:phage baseplate assembly protein W
MQVDFPIRFDGHGRTATTGEADHVRDMIEQFLFTSPGERVNRPEFGSGLLRQVFEPNQEELEAVLQFTIQAGLQRWLGDLVEVRTVEVQSEDATLRVAVGYVLRRTGTARSDTFRGGLP